jgi:hypothetical protein
MANSTETDQPHAGQATHKLHHPNDLQQRLSISQHSASSQVLTRHMISSGDRQDLQEAAESDSPST